MIEIKVKDDKAELHMSGSAGELFAEMYGILERLATVLKEDDRGPEYYSEFCKLLRSVADGKTIEEYAAKLAEELTSFS